MAYFPDLITEPQIESAPYVRAVGWLAANHSFKTGRVPAHLAQTLSAICARWFEGLEVLDWPVAVGTHTCELCDDFRASGHVGVPGLGVLYVAPQMIAHYANQQSSLPPSKLLDAVLSCPMPGSQEYAQAVRAVINVDAAPDHP